MVEQKLVMKYNLKNTSSTLQTEQTCRMSLGVFNSHLDNLMDIRRIEIMTEKEKTNLEEIIKNDDSVLEKSIPSEETLRESEKYNQIIRDTQEPPEHEPGNKKK